MQVSAMMVKIHTIVKLLKTPKKMIYPLSQNGFLKWMPDELFLKILYWSELDRKLDLNNPVLFSEKIQWLKLNDRNPAYISLVDKYLVKEYVAEKIGAKYIIPTIGVWDKVEQIDISTLPASFVLKCNHDSGGVVICKDKTLFNPSEAFKILKTHMKENAFYFSREWPYKYISKKIIAEKYISDPDHVDPIDYKFYCFNGIPQFCQVIQNRSEDETIDFYDMNWNHLPFTGLGLQAKQGRRIEKPLYLEEMRDVAQALAEGTEFVRVDLYNIEGKVYFGEFTLYPKSGLGRFSPDEWNRMIGDMIQLRNKDVKKHKSVQ